MVPKDFGSEFREEPDMPPEIQEKTPGVYVRAENELPHELDMLWSGSKSYPKEERSPLISFIAGVLVGGILTAAVFLLFIIQPQIKTGPSQITTPVNETVDSSQPAATNGAPASGNTQGGTAATPAAAGAQNYTVQSGDTLGTIAEKVYGSSAPKYVEKIQTANNMSSPDALQIDQKLIIPPKDY